MTAVVKEDRALSQLEMLCPAHECCLLGGGKEGRRETEANRQTELKGRETRQKREVLKERNLPSLLHGGTSLSCFERAHIRI